MNLFRLILILILSLTHFVGCATQSHKPPTVQAFATRADGTQTYIVISNVYKDSIDSHPSIKKIMYQQAQEFCLSLPAGQQTKAILDRLSTRQDNLEMVFICE